MKYRKTNNLINEKSPYLLQHAYNPVNWHAWSKEAFSKAKVENKPIFLSIGYSTCHWCHVMEQESFEDVVVAEVLNKHFISIKVDREERPDIDSIYMNVCQMLTGGGGWPLTVFLTPEQKPFFAGTYFPKTTLYGRPGLIDVLNHIALLWKNNKNKIFESSNYITDIINKVATDKSENVLEKGIIKDAFNNLVNRYDQKYGGFDNAPKFPMPTYLLFLIRYNFLHEDTESLSILEQTLENIYRGGIYDHIGFGFARYSTDDKWLVPHFEKMLYDNALLSIVYTELYHITKKDLYRKITDNTLNYLLREMKAEDGGFYSAEDADSEGVEGKFYVWSYEEILKILGKEDGDYFCNQYNITEKGNFEGCNIINLIGSKHAYIDEKMRNKLFSYREERVHPYKDDKILTSWNGLVIASLAIAGKVFGNNDYINEAIRTVDFIYCNLFNNEGRLLARYREKDASILGYADDYAFLCWGLIELYEATFDEVYLKRAIDLNCQLIRFFWDESNGGLFLYGNDAEELISRPKEIYDGVIPSANSVSTMNWLRLSRLTGNDDFQKYADEQFKTFSHEIMSNPTACLYMLSAYMFNVSKTMEIVLVGDRQNLKTLDMIKIINDNYNPFITTLLKENEDGILKIAPYLKKYKVTNETTAYICEGKSCIKPITDITEFSSIVKKPNVMLGL